MGSSNTAKHKSGKFDSVFLCIRVVFQVAIVAFLTWLLIGLLRPVYWKYSDDLNNFISRSQSRSITLGGSGSIGAPEGSPPHQPLAPKTAGQEVDGPISVPSQDSTWAPRKQHKTERTADASTIPLPVPSTSTGQPHSTPPAPNATTSKQALLEKHKITPEKIVALSQNGYIMVTFANHHYLDFTLSWVEHVKACGVTGYLVAAMDDELLEDLDRLNINVFTYMSGLTTGDFGWGSPSFAVAGRMKVKIIAQFLQMGVQVVFSDVDVTWLRNPFPFFDRFRDADILTSSDSLRTSVKDESLERYPEIAAPFNIGILVFRQKSVDFVLEWSRMIDKDITIWDQNAFNDLARMNLDASPHPQNLIKIFNGNLLLGILPVPLFASGHAMFVQHMHEKMGLKPYAAHAIYQYSGTPGKRHRLREHFLWHDPPEYYDFPKGFLMFQPSIPQHLLEKSGPRTGRMDMANVVGHFELVNHQLVQIRQAMAIATVTGRALIMPEIWCGLDRWWAPHPGHIPGSNFDLPFICPMDYIFDLEGGWANEKLNEHDFGPRVHFREHTFLDNPRLPAAVRDDKVVVEMCQDGDCSDGTSPASLKDKKVRLRSGLSSSQLLTALSTVQNHKVLVFDTMFGAFSNFSDPIDWKKFESRCRLYNSLWCCIDAQPGHIWYNMMWDIPGAMDRHGNIGNGTFVYKTGP